MDVENKETAHELLERLGLIPRYGWKARFDYEPEFTCRPFNLPRLSQMKEVLSMAFRYTFNFYLRKRFIEHRLPFLDPSRHVPWTPIYGVPMGGIGSGALGRGFRGEFVRSSLIPGIYSYEAQPADQFILTLRRDGRTIHQQVLSPKTATPGSVNGLRDWSWSFPAESAHYIGLYPRSWTIYELPQYQLILVCQQISPVIPNDYKTTCLPACVFLWQALNLGKQPIEVSITFSWHGPDQTPRNTSASVIPTESNGINFETRSASVETPKPLVDPLPTAYLSRSATFSSKTSSIAGCFIERVIGNELPCCFGIAAKKTEKVTVNRCPGFLFSKSQSNNQSGPAKPRSPVTIYGAASEGDQDAELTAYHSYRTAPSAKAIWDQLRSMSGLVDVDSAGYNIPNIPSTQKQSPKVAVAVNATCTVPGADGEGETLVPGQVDMEFAIVWHSPIVRFRSGEVIYTRRYARWFSEPGMRGAKQLLEHALSEWPKWVEKIEQWQNPILQNTSFPDWYKSALFNELYFLTDGGTVWLDPVEVEGMKLDESDVIPIDFIRAHRKECLFDPQGLTGRQLGEVDKNNEAKRIAWQHRCEIARDMGIFGYLEGHEYRMFNTIDVHYNASWALIKLWPRLQLAINYDCADLTVAEDRTMSYFIHHGQSGIRSAQCAVPHDFGDPEHDPWRHPNAYIMFQTDNWKDLNPKFILQVWRDWKLTGDYHYLLYMMPIVSRVLGLSLRAWDLDNDGIIENSGFPDQTYDAWTTHGLSAYTGGLWVACVYATYDMLWNGLSDASPVKQYLESATDYRGVAWPKVMVELYSLLIRCKHSYDTSLWTGSYYAYQRTRSGNHDSIMADQLSGHWFLRVSGAPADAILPKKHVIETLKTIHASNCKAIHDGSLGAINGSLPGCKMDLSCVQAEEFWVGVNYSLAATMIAEDMTEEGLLIAGACYNTIYYRFGLQYQTPEAYMMDGRFRCPGYMRPLAIWSIQQAFELREQQKQSSNLVNGKL